MIKGLRGGKIWIKAAQVGTRTENPKVKARMWNDFFYECKVEETRRYIGRSERLSEG